MPNKNLPERPNRVVTCQTCGVQMPQRYLASHMRKHEQAAALPLPVDAESSPEPAGEVPVGGDLICPACAEFVAEQVFTQHMQALHTNWCPLCHTRAKDLSEHLHSRHLLKPIQPPPPYERSWETQKRFICLGCRKKVSVWSYPKHELPHGATRGLAQKAGLSPTYRAPRPPAAENAQPAAGKSQPAADNTQPAVETVVCTLCQQDVAKDNLTLHLTIAHPACPICKQRINRQDLNAHIAAQHPHTRPAK